MSTKNISDLPVEILLKIFEKLKASERFSLAEVCIDWLNITQHPAIMDITHITKSDAVDCFIQSSRKFKFSLKLETNLPVNFLQFTYKFSENIYELRFHKMHLPSYYDLIVNITNLTNLKNLEINMCSFKRGDCLMFPSDLRLNLKSLLLISLDEIKSMKGYEVNHLLLIIPNLNILSCSLSDDYCFQKAIVNYLKNSKLSKSIKELHFISFNNAEVLSSVFQTNHLKLEKFYWTCFKKIDCISDVEFFLSNQTNLKILDLVLLGTNFVRSIVKICSKINLEQLTFNLNNEIIEDSHILEELWNLKYLKIFCCNSSIFKSLNKISEMENLNLFCYLDDLTDHAEKLQFLTSLKSFQVSQTLINDTLIQAVFKHLLNLRELLFSDSGKLSQITDFGITGNSNGYPLSRLEHLEKIALDVGASGVTKTSLRHIESLKNIKNVFIPRSATIGSSDNPLFNYFYFMKQSPNRCLDFY